MGDGELSEPVEKNEEHRLVLWVQAVGTAVSIGAGLLPGMPFSQIPRTRFAVF